MISQSSSARFGLVRTALGVMLGVALAFTVLRAQAPATPSRQPAPAPWRFAGERPCVGPEGGVLQCPPVAKVVAVRAGRLFDSESGRMLSRQVIVATGERITEVGPESQVRIPAGAVVIDLSQATVVPGLIDTHSHIYNNRQPRMSSERSAMTPVPVRQSGSRGAARR